MTASRSAWQRYWQEDRLAACVPDNAASAAAIEAQWLDFFAKLPAGARVLDIATGNGVLLLWALRSACREPVLTGIDAADIDPRRFLKEQGAELASATFFGNTPAESLPFADASFDVVVSQYGLEYADLAPALGEVARVLTPGGRLQWLAHAGESVVVSQGRARLADIDLLLASDGPFARMQAFLQAQQRGKKTARAIQELTEALRVAEAHCAANPSAELVRTLCAGILDTANRLEHYRHEDVEHWLRENRKRLRGERQRILDLQSARLGSTRRTAVEQLLGSPSWARFSITSLAVGEGAQPVGELITAVRG